ncbi:MAG: DUF4142 domain-containing protein [Ramlibacter sp.]|nr:DUF4142 domain-containing protein [Ramlibacter sp.]
MNLTSSGGVAAMAAVLLLAAGCDSRNESRSAKAQPPATGQAQPAAGAQPVSSAAAQSVEQIIASWPEHPRLGAVEMIAKYGPPHESTSERLVWHNVGAFKRVAVLKLETPHDFPMPHVDFMEHTIAYDVPQDKVGDLIAFDASSTINRTVGELSARCDLEGHNILTLNLDHDIVTGKKTVAQARQAFGENVQQDIAGKNPPYIEALQFQPASGTTAAFRDKSVIPGSPVRATAAAAAETKAMGNVGSSADAEVLATVIAIDLNEILAAGQAKMKKLSPPVMEYAKMLHEHHGMNAGETMKLGQQIGVTPVITAKVEQVQRKGAGELAALVPLKDEQFERAYVTAMVKGHTDVLNTIDNELVKAAGNDALKGHLTKTRGTIAEHLEKAKSLESGLKR